MTDWNVEVIVHAKVPAETAGDALGMLCDFIRDGIGPDPDDGEDERRWGTAIAAATVWDPATPGIVHITANEEYQARHRRPT